MAEVTDGGEGGVVCREDDVQGRDCREVFIGWRKSNNIVKDLNSGGLF